MVDLTSACVAQYKMNDLSGTTVVDSQGFSNGTSANPVTPVAGKIGGALSFNGTSDYVDTNKTFQSIFQDSFTINLWCKVTNGQSVEQYLEGVANAPDTAEVSLYIDASGNLFADLCIAGSTANEIGALTFSSGLNDWKMITHVVTYMASNQGRTTLYVNGSLVADSGIIGMIKGNYFNTYNPYIGSYNWAGTLTEPMTGVIDDICIFNKALSTEEIAFLWNNGNGTEDLKEENMAITTTLVPTLHAQGLAPANQWTVNATSSDFSGCEILKAAVSNKSHYICKIVVTTASAINMTIGSGASAGAVITPIIGPLYFTSGGPGVFTYDFADHPVKVTIGLDLTVDASGAGSGCVLVQGFTA